MMKVSLPTLLLVQLLLFFFLPSLVRSETACDIKSVCIGSNSNNNNTFACTRSHSRAVVIVELDNKIEAPRYYPFCVVVDKLTQVAMKDTAMSYLSRNANSTLRVLVGPTSTEARSVFGSTSVLQQQVDADTPYTPFFTAVVTLRSGLLSGNVSFLDSCVNGHCELGIGSAAASGCIRGRECSQRVQNLDQFTHSNSTMKVFVAWSGEDKLLSPLDSITLTPLHMRSFTFTSTFNSVVSNVLG